MEHIETKDSLDSELQICSICSIRIRSRIDEKWALKKDGGFFKKARKAFPMFPFVENRMKWDDYGELITQDDYKLISQADNQVFGIF